MNLKILTGKIFIKSLFGVLSHIISLFSSNTIVILHTLKMLISYFFSMCFLNVSVSYFIKVFSRSLSGNPKIISLFVFFPFDIIDGWFVVYKRFAIEYGPYPE